jgi:hypothetical protein
MSNYIDVDPKHPSVAPIIKATFPQYRRKKATLVTGGSVTFHDLNWSGGTRSEYMACMLDGTRAVHASQINQPPPWQNPYEGVTAEIPMGACVVSCGTFCGKPGKLYIYLNAEDVTKFLPSS